MGCKNEHDVCVVYQNFSFDIKILHCGIEKDPNHILIDKKIDRYTISYICEGLGYYTTKSKYYELKKGDIYLLAPNTKYSQRTHSKNNYRYIYISFCGPSSKFLLEKCGLTPDYPLLSVNDDFIENKFKKIYDLCSINSFTSIAKANLAFFEILCYLIEKNKVNNSPIKLTKNAIVESAQMFIEANYNNDITIDTICRHVFCNRSYLSKLFKTICNTTIMDYLINYRIEKAMDMLIHTNLTAVNISEKVGFSDYANFYRHFIEKTGRSPKVYRRENLNSINTIVLETQENDEK